jgi:hypothetical protein
MKRTKVIRLVLLGGGVATMIAACGDDRTALRRACEEARAQLRPDAAQICQRSTSATSGAGWLFGRSYASRPDTRRTTQTAAPSTRGGFGGSASSRSGS